MAHARRFAFGRFCYGLAPTLRRIWIRGGAGARALAPAPARCWLAAGPVLALALILAVFAPVQTSAQNFRGKVVDQADGHPLRSAAVFLIDSLGKETEKKPELTDSVGGFRLDAPDEGRYQIRVTLIGYNGGLSDTVRIGEHERIEVELQLSTQAIALAPIIVKAHKKLPEHLEMVGFNQRRKNGFGTYVDRKMIRGIGVGTLLDVLRLAPGVIVSPGGFNGRGEVMMARSAALHCRPTVYLDGTPVQQGGTGGNRFGMPDPRLEDLLDADDVAAVEIYRGESEPPIEYSGKQARCGVILIWSRTEEDKPDAE